MAGYSALRLSGRILPQAGADREGFFARERLGAEQARAV